MPTSLLDVVALDLRNLQVVLEVDQRIRDGLRQSAWLGSKMNEEVAMLRMQIARFANEFTEKGMQILGQTE